MHSVYLSCLSVQPVGWELSNGTLRTIKIVYTGIQFTAQLLPTEVAWPIICNLDTCRFVTIGFERKSPNELV